MKRRGHNTYSDIALQIIQLAIAVIYCLVIYCLLLTYCYRCYPLFSILQYGHHIVHTMLHAEVFRNIMAAHWCLGSLFLRLELDKIRNDRVRVSWLHAESHVLLIRQLSLEFIRHTARLCSFYMMIYDDNRLKWDRHVLVHAQRHPTCGVLFLSKQEKNCVVHRCETVWFMHNHSFSEMIVLICSPFLMQEGFSATLTVVLKSYL